MLIDVSYFTDGVRHIENATTAPVPSIAQAATNKAVEAYISECQKPFLAAMLGNWLADAAESYLENGIEDSEMESLLEKLKVPFADYVFYQIAASVNTSVFLTGCVQLKTANRNVSPIELQCRAWNRMVLRNRSFVAWAGSEDCKYDIRVDRNFLVMINVYNL